MKNLKPTFAPLLLLTILTLSSSVAVFAVTYWHDTQTTTVSFGEGGTATFQNVALPVAYLQTPTQYLEANALNISTYVDNTQMVLTQTTSQRTNLLSNFDTFILTVKVAGTGTVAVTWDLLLADTVVIPLTVAGSYGFDYDYSYTGKQSSGTLAIDWDLDLVSV
jgi:hypothetical protein